MGEADLAVGPDRATDGNVLAEELMPSKWVAWLSPQHPLASKPILKWRDLAGIEFQTGGYDHERIIEQAAASLPAEESLVPGQVFDNISTALGFAAANLGVTLCPAYVAPMAQAFDLEMRRLIDPEFTRYVMLYSSAIRPRTEVVAAFAQHLAQRFEAVAETSNSRSSRVAAQ
jgi:DNA-binding transcriptional LysR family regulator